MKTIKTISSMKKECSRSISNCSENCVEAFNGRRPSYSCVLCAAGFDSVFDKKLVGVIHR